MAVKFKTAVELEVEVHGGVDFPVQPRGWDPGDPGGCELECVLLKVEGRCVDVLPYLSDEIVKELEVQLFNAAEEQAEDRAIEAAEARYDARKEGE